jgi:hypothetical protein
MHPPWLAPDVAQELEVQLVVPLLERVADGRLQAACRKAGSMQSEGSLMDALKKPCWYIHGRGDETRPCSKLIHRKCILVHQSD